MLARSYRGLLAAAIAAALPVAAAADGNAGIIYGRVLLSGSDRPVCPITIRVFSDRESPWTTRTKADGSFVFLQIQPGPVTVVVGSNRERRRVTVSANLSNQELFYLQPLRSSRRVMVTRDIARSCPGASYHNYAGE